MIRITLRFFAINSAPYCEMSGYLMQFYPKIHTSPRVHSYTKLTRLSCKGTLGRGKRRASGEPSSVALLECYLGPAVRSGHEHFKRLSTSFA